MALKSAPNKFVREKNRTVQDVFNKFIKPALETFADDIGQKVTRHAEKHHTFQNQTGALQDSMRWEVERRRHGYDVTIVAGGSGRIINAFRVDKIASRPRVTGLSRRRRGLTATGKLRKTRRAGGLLKGTITDVGYATFVEKKGFSVLVNAVVYYRRRVPRLMKRWLKGATARI